MAAADQGNKALQLDLKILTLNISGLRKKTNFLKYIIQKYKPDIVCLQETNISDNYHKNKVLYELGLGNENCFFNFPSTKSNGTAILCISPDFKLINSVYHDEGRTIILQLQINCIKYTIVNVYAPTNPTQRVNYLNELFTHINNVQNRVNTIIAGDFNITLEEIDIQGERGNQRIGRAELKNIVDAFTLNDAFRQKNPGVIDSTFINKTHCRSARLDRVYFSNNIPICKAFHIASTLDFTDHKAVLIKQ